ncbi:MAG TPA: ABC transporter ATP-binding protein [Candidatus Eisenbacteria bacterium]|nr:ABC transporter ATP-binding protein [Candidatus Eisenbacteria bacterium]
MSANAQAARPPLLDVRAVRKTFVSRGFLTSTRSVVAAEDVSFRIRRGESVALVGESGSGKSTLARLVLRLDRPDSGEIRLDGVNVLERERRRASLAYRGRVQMVFQDPFGSLNSVHTVEHHLVRPLVRHRRAAPGEARDKAAELLRTVGLEPAEEFLGRRPYELSGGQRQRVAIARALAVDPDLLVADEPTSMLDVSIRMGVLNLLARLKRERGLAILLITHDLASARYLSDRILVLYAGRVVEDGPSGAIVASPAHPYTRALRASIAEAAPVTPGVEPRVASVAAPARAAVGCPFAPRCPEVLDVCRTTDPAPRLVDGRRVRCHLYPAQAAGAED